MKFTIFVDHPLVIIIINSVCLIYAQENYINFTLFTLFNTSIFLKSKNNYQISPQIPFRLGRGGGGHEIYIFLSHYPTDKYYAVRMHILGMFGRQSIHAVLKHLWCKLSYSKCHSKYIWLTRQIKIRLFPVCYLPT